jgi:hypothetical protein
VVTSSVVNDMTSGSLSVDKMLFIHFFPITDEVNKLEKLLFILYDNILM